MNERADAMAAADAGRGPFEASRAPGAAPGAEPHEPDAIEIAETIPLDTTWVIPVAVGAVSLGLRGAGRRGTPAIATEGAGSAT